MASEAEEETTFQECGLCFENDDLKRLPCNPEHIYCIKCLTKDSEVTEIVKCPLCRIVFDEGIDDIPSADAPLDKLLCCDVCMRKDDKRKYAQIYCVICQKKFCKPHMDAHNFALDDHKRITMDEYKKEYRKVEIRRCETHTDQAYSVACNKCNQVSCAVCVAVDPGRCTDGSSHRFTELQILVDDFIKLINDMKLWIFDKEERLLGLVKQITRVLSDWDSETGEMITKLHAIRDMQIEKLTEKYNLLEKKIQKLRNQSKNEVTSFLDEDIGTKLDKISRGVKKIDSRIFTYHQVDIVRGLNETENMTRELLKLDLPQYKPSESHIKLCEKDSTVELALEIRADKSFSLVMPELTQKPQSIPSPLQIPDIPPSSLKLHRECSVRNNPKSVCHHLQYTYVGCRGSVDRVKQDGQVEHKFIGLCGNDFVHSLAVKDNQLYLLAISFFGKCRFQVHHLSGLQIIDWTNDIHFILGDHNVEFALTRNSIVVPDPEQRQFILYSLAGDIIKRIPCHLLTGTQICMAALGNNSVFVTVRVSNTVFRINVDSEEVMWTSVHVAEPHGVVCYKDRYVLVSRSGSSRLWSILDINTGECVGELTGHQGGRITAMNISGDNLIISCTSRNRHNPTYKIKYYNIE